MTATTTREPQASAHNATQSRARPSNWALVTYGLAAASVLVLVLYLLLAWQQQQRPFIGALFTHTLTINAGVPISGESWPAQEAGLQRGDRLVSIDGQTLADDPTNIPALHAAYHRLLSELNVGDRVTVTVARPLGAPNVDAPICELGDGSALCTTSLDLIAFPQWDFLVFFAMPYVSAWLVLALGLAVIRLRVNQPEARLGAFISFAGAVYMAGLYDMGSSLALAPVWLMAGPMLAAALITLGLTFPSPVRTFYRYPSLRYGPMALAIAASVALIVWYYNPAHPWDAGVAQVATLTLVVAQLVTLAFVLGYQIPRTTSATQRDQANSILIGLLMVTLPVALWFGNRFLVVLNLTPLPLPFEALMPLFFFPTAAVAYAVLQYRRVDTDRVLSQGITYTIMGAALILGYFLLVFGVSLIARDLINADDPLLIAVTLFAMVSLFQPVRTRLQGRIDAIYFRQRQNYQQQLEAFIQSLTNLTDRAEIVKRFRATIDGQLQPAAIFIFFYDRVSGDYEAYASETDIRFTADSGVVSLLSQGERQIVYLRPGEAWPHDLWPDKARLTLLKARTLAGLPGAERLNGFVILGPPRSGRGLYAYEETRFLTNVISQLTIAIERTTVIESMERRVSELNVLSQVGQAVNFTIEFDDLLELISTQTNRLIEAPYFYIALYEETVEQLYFAFFLEGDERYHDQEDVRWPVDSGLFSEVAKQARPLRVTHYAQEMARRGADIRLESKDLRAWMGIPLMARTRNLGVIAIAKVHDTEPFTDDQFKIFSDIASLAASSLERTQLFTETKIRERQLTVLNEISRQLVATESDVERLLEIIMSSAVEILNAEAGSLFLMTEDGSSQLEFRVVVGGGGENLIGNRIPVGQGVVGEVALFGRPVISNDAAHDPRHLQELSGEFRASSLLAVPLIANDVVIGVLELVNKQDGTIFLEDDADLLTTFAGQAAIAIQNARNFRMTDLQLESRVRELETLERIDSQLNRTLDLNEVARITIQAAMTNVNAQAGALGLVEGAPPHLRVVALEGYDPSQFPEWVDTETMIWPLNRGILRRVMRTRSPDYAPDISIDPDYEPGLENSIGQITIPMKSGDDINAILILETNRAPGFTLNGWAFAQRIAEHASIAIANAQLYAELSMANASKSEFMGFAAHEIKNPLTSLIGYSDSLLKGMLGDLSDQQQMFINTIYSNAMRINTIITDLRDAARMEANLFSVELDPINIYPVIVETLRPFQHMLESKKQTLVNQVSENLPLVMGDQNRLIQVLTNLVSNANKYSPENTTITIDAEVRQSHQRDNGTRIGPCVVVSVTDQGIGMSEEDLNKLFRERYFRSDNPLAQEQKGTGLGMMLTYGIMQQHDGDIWVASQLGAGSTFFIAVPLAHLDDDASADQEQDATPEAASD